MPPLLKPARATPVEDRDKIHIMLVKQSDGQYVATLTTYMEAQPGEVVGSYEGITGAKIQHILRLIRP